MWASTADTGCMSSYITHELYNNVTGEGKINSVKDELNLIYEADGKKTATFCDVSVQSKNKVTVLTPINNSGYYCF